MLVALREAGALGVSRSLLARGRASAPPVAAGLRAALWQGSAVAVAAAAAGRRGTARATALTATSRRPSAYACSRASCAPAACLPPAPQPALAQQRLAGGLGSSGRSTLAAAGCSSSRSSSSRATGITPRALSNATMQQQPSAVAQDSGAAGAAAGAGLAKAVVRAPAGADALVVTVSLGAKTCNLNRPCDELLEKALTRLAKNLIAKPSKKEKRKKPAGGPSAGPSSAEASQDDGGGGAGAAVLYADAEGKQPLPLTLTNGEAWRRGVLLEVAGERFAVEVNPPTVDKITIDRLAMVGYPTAAAVQLSFAEVGGCRWRWAAQRPGESEWRDLGCATQHYTPRPEDEGCVLRVECTPTAARPARRAEKTPGAEEAAGGAPAPAAAEREGNGEAAAEAEAKAWLGDTVSAVTGPVGRGPERCSASVRCGATAAAHVAAPAFRILSYNILADQYAGSEYAQNVLFKYCPKENLDPAYRRALVLRELLGYHADVICLQEVDERAFTDFLSLHLRLHGYEGHYTNKQGKVKEGSATFWRTARFRALSHQDIRLREAFALPLPPLHSQFGPMLEASRELATALQQVTTIAQATLLAPVSPSSSEGCLCVVNTHLFFHPYAPHIRTMHTAGILEEAAAFLARCADGTQPPAAGANLDELRTAASFGPGPEAPGVSVSASMSGGLQRPTVVFCGDLNSDLNDGIPGVVELLRKGALPHDYWDWVQGAAFKWGMGEEDAEAMAQGTAQLQEAAAAASAAAAAAAAGSPPPSAVGATRSASMSSVDPAAAAAATGSLFAADGHAFESASTTPAVPIAVTGVDIRLPYVFRAADDLATPYTNYTSGYKALLDYVWYEEAVLKVLGTAAPVPSEQELGGFIPSPAFPSDHLAVVYDMTWRRPGDGSA